jgi:hypothetical protein
MMKLEHPPVADEEVQTHGQQGGDINQGQDVNKKSGNEGRENEQEEENRDCQAKRF